MDVFALVGLNLQRLRRNRQVSQEELAFRAESTRGYLSGIENGKRNVTIEVLDRLARALEVDIAEFFINPLEARPPAKNRSLKKRAVKKSAPKQKPIRGRRVR